MARVSLSDRVRHRVRRNVLAPFERRVARPFRGLLNAGRAYRPVFVCGASGSGTSFLALSLASRFDCAGVVYEMDVQISERSFLHVPALTVEAYPDVAAYRDFIAPKTAWSVERGRDDLLDMCRAHATGSSDVVVAKGPDINLLRARFLAECFPEARFVLIFRDPVANVEGLRRKWETFGNDTLEHAIAFYAEIHEAFLDAAAAFAERAVGIEYETLVERPDEALDAIGARLGLSPAARTRRLPTRPNVEGKGIRNVSGDRIGVVTDANVRARERLGAPDVAAVERALGALWDRMRNAPFTLRLDAGGDGPAARVPREG